MIDFKKYIEDLDEIFGPILTFLKALFIICAGIVIAYGIYLI